MALHDEAYEAQADRLQRHANKTFDVASDLLVDLFDDRTDAPLAGYEEVYDLLVQAEDELQVACRRIDDAARIVRRKVKA